MIVSQSNERAGRDGSAFKSIDGARELAFYLLMLPSHID